MTPSSGKPLIELELGALTRESLLIATSQLRAQKAMVSEFSALTR